MTRICPECQTENDDNREFCRECGVNLVDVASSESDDASENKWALKLFYWKDEKTNKSESQSQKSFQRLYSCYGLSILQYFIYSFLMLNTVFFQL